MSRDCSLASDLVKAYAVTALKLPKMAKIKIIIMRTAKATVRPQKWNEVYQ